MKAFSGTLALVIATTVFGQHVSQAAEEPRYNSNGQVIAYHYPDGTGETYSYDSTGQVRTSSDRSGSVTVSKAPSSNNSGPANGTAQRRHPKPTPTPIPTPTPTPTPPVTQAKLHTSYHFFYSQNSPQYQSVTWSLSGSTEETAGGYAGGTFGPFGRIGALMESTPVTDTSANTVTRDIYVLDIAAGGNSNGVTLYVYTRTDTVGVDYATANANLKTTISLPLVGGQYGGQPVVGGTQWVLASMAANDNVIVIGTNQSLNAVVLRKSDFAMTQYNGGSGSPTVSAITTDQFGYLAITFGSFNSTNNGEIMLDPDGALTEFGGSPEFMANDRQAVLTTTLP